MSAPDPQDPARSRRALLFPALVLAGLLLEVWVLAPGVQERTAADDVQYWEAHVDRNPTYAQAHLRLGIAYRAADRTSDAASAYRAARELDPSLEAAAIGLFDVLRQTGSEAEAASILSDYLETHPGCVVCWQNLTYSRLAAGDLDAAAASAARLLSLDLEDVGAEYGTANLPVEARRLAGRVFAARGEHERAADLFRRAAALAPDDVSLHLALARSLIALGRTAEASVALDDAGLLLESNSAAAARHRRTLAQLRRALRRSAGS